LLVLRPRQLFRLVLQLSALLVLSRLLNAGIGKTLAASPRVLTVRSYCRRFSAALTPGGCLIHQVPYSDFVRAVKSNKVATLQVDGAHVMWQQRTAATDRSRDARAPAALSAALSTAAPAPLVAQQPPAELPLIYASTRPADSALPYEQLLGNGVTYGAPDKRGGGRVMSVLLTMLYIGLIVSFLARLPGMAAGMRLPGMGAAVGRRKDARERGGGGGGAPPDVTFADVAGVDEAKEELQEVVEVLRHPERFAQLGARPPAGVLLVGAPGTGKTLLAKAVAGEAGVPFFSVAASEFIELYVGMGAARVREVFAKARAAAPSIVFIDEIDAVAKGRSDGRMRGMGNDEREQTLNQLLTELDGFENGGSERGGKLVICLAATNRPDVLDAALRRPGRFDRTVSVERPDRRGREEILGVHVRLRGCPLAADVRLPEVAAQTPGFTGADLALLVNEAALLSARRGLVALDAAAFQAAIMRAAAGLERKRSLLFGLERACVARHEAGHALVGAAVADLLPPGAAQRAAALSIVARSNGALGYAYTPPSATEEGERALLFADELRGRLAVLMAGRAAEEATGSGRVSTGASDDIQRATELAVRAVAEFGFSGAVGPLNLAKLAAWGEEQGLFGSTGQGATSSAAELEVALLLKGAMAAAKALLEANAALLERIGAQLEADEKLAGDTLAALLADVKEAQLLRDFVTGTWLPRDI